MEECRCLGICNGGQQGSSGKVSWKILDRCPTNMIAAAAADEHPAGRSVPVDLLDKAGVALDIVTADALICNCFTSTYGRYIKVGVFGCVEDEQQSNYEYGSNPFQGSFKTMEHQDSYTMCIWLGFWGPTGDICSLKHLP